MHTKQVLGQGRALVLGATGGVGGEVARQLLRAGWRVRGLRRTAAPAAAQRDGNADDDGIEWVVGDALDAQAVGMAAAACDVIVHAVNPPGYRNWGKLVLPMLRNTIAAADAEGALIVLPGTVYNYGPDAFPAIREDAPQHPRTRKGAIRVRMEDELRGFSERGGRVLVVRAGDFFGQHSGNSWFAQGLVKPGGPVLRIANPSAPGTGHLWSYLPDVAATMVALIERRATLPAFANYHMGGHWDPDGRAMPDAIRRAVARRTGHTPRITRFPWWLVRLAAPFVPTLRELLEMRYLWRHPVRMDNTRLLAQLGSEPHTPLDAAVERTLCGLGCIPAPDGAERTAVSAAQRDAQAEAAGRVRPAAADL